MVKQFNDIAHEYDAHFTHTQIGKSQRNLVYNHLNKVLPKDKKWNILELNGGTGVDSIWLANKGHKVLCTDISEEMIKIAKAKTQNANLNFETLDINKLAEFQKKEKFDMIFSNFGGINCLSPEELQLSIINSKEKLSKGGRLILVIMSKQCLWENLFYSLKKEWKEVGRRKKEFVHVQIGEKKVKTYYYNPNDIIERSRNAFRSIKIRPIGFFVPPSYLEPIFRKRKVLLSIFYKLDLLFNRFAFLGRFSDHYLIELEKK